MVVVIVVIIIAAMAARAGVTRGVMDDAEGGSGMEAERRAALSRSSLLLLPLLPPLPPLQQSAEASMLDAT